jgi:hypothetical protein
MAVSILMDSTHTTAVSEAVMVVSEVSVMVSVDTVASEALANNKVALNSAAANNHKVDIQAILTLILDSLVGKMI